MKMRTEAKNAILIGTLCSIAYLAVYIARNILSATSPGMIDEGAYTEETIGTMSSLYFIFYAIGQLINGMIGDKIKAKYMICFGLLLAGISNISLVLLREIPWISIVAYAMTGFFLSMIYGPMTKIVSENTEPLHASRCSLGYTFASFLGSPAAGALAAAIAWQGVFFTSSAILVFMAIVVLASFSILEKKDIIRYGRFKAAKKGSGNIGVLVKRHIVKFALISVITGVVRTSVVFWLPVYISQHLDFSAKDSAKIFSVATLVISLSAFIAIFLCEKLGNDMHKTVLITFISATVFFALTYFISNPIANLICIVLAILSSNCSASVLWSLYCPSLRDTGVVSSATGFLDFVSYSGAAIANIAFANAISTMGWGNLILIWFGLMVLGVIVCLPYRQMFKKKSA